MRPVLLQAFRRACRSRKGSSLDVHGGGRGGGGGLQPKQEICTAAPLAGRLVVYTAEVAPKRQLLAGIPCHMPWEAA